MEKNNFTKQFASRLREAMISAGYNSHRSPSGVCVLKLAEITNYSVQICRKYLRGEAIPEPEKIAEIAGKLNVSPGWLLFGDSHQSTPRHQNEVTINKQLLFYVLSHAKTIYAKEELAEDIPVFLLDLISDVSEIEGSEEQCRKIIDLSFSSIDRFTQLQEKNKNIVSIV